LKKKKEAIKMKNIIEDADNALIDPKTGMLRTESLALKELLCVQINRILTISSSLPTCESLREFQVSVQTFANCLRAAENLISKFLDKKYKDAQKEIMAQKYMPFDGKYKEWISKLHLHDTLDNEKYNNAKLNYNLCNWVKQLNASFREFMEWCARAGMSLGLEGEEK